MESTAFRYDIMGLVNDMGVNISDISSLYSEYIAEMKLNIQESKILCSEKDWYKLQRVIHNMKGISISLNIIDIHDTAAALDKQLKLGKYDRTSMEVKKIELIFKLTESDIREFFKQHNITI